MENTQYSFEDYENPPVIEVALSVQFEPLRELRTAHIGLLWQKYKKRLVNLEEQPPLEPAFELFEGQRFLPRIELTDMPPIRRCWFKNNDGTELVQVQQDRFAHNWRRLTTDDTYPRYNIIRKKFLHDLQVFQHFLEESHLGQINLNQCEITYVNPIPLEDEWESYGQLDKVLTVVSDEYSDDFLPVPEDINLALRYLISDDSGKPLGRLHIGVHPVRDPNGRPHFFLRLTARGAPSGQSNEAVMAFMDKGHEWIVRGFTCITTDRMHTKWGRERRTRK